MILIFSFINAFIDSNKGNDNSKHKMRRRPSQAQAEEEIEDEAAEAAELCRMLMDGMASNSFFEKNIYPIYFNMRRIV